MTLPADDPLLDRLERGDVAAVEELAALYGPYLRAVARGHLSARMRPHVDSADVVQSVWVQVVRKLRADGWKVETEDELKVVLATIARRRALNRVRRHAPDRDRGRPLDEVPPPAAPAPRPSEVAQADDLWDRLVQLCPAEHLEILRLRRDGLTPAEIAARTGLHPGSVRRALRRLARDLADETEPPAADDPE